MSRHPRRTTSPRIPRRAVAAGHVTQEEADRRPAHLTQGPFLAAVTFSLVVAEA
ncbi:hypothetical protein [Streptomyces sp. NPDC003480]